MTAANRAQYSHPGTCLAISASSVADASPSSTTDSVRRARRHAPAVDHARIGSSARRCPSALRAGAAGAGRATSRFAGFLFRTWSSPPRVPRANASQHGRAPLAPGVADGRCRGSSTDESRFSPWSSSTSGLTTRRRRSPTSSIAGCDDVPSSAATYLRCRKSQRRDGVPVAAGTLSVYGPPRARARHKPATKENVEMSSTMSMDPEPPSRTDDSSGSHRPPRMERTTGERPRAR